MEFGNATRYYAHSMTAETTDTVDIRLTVPRDIPEGTVAFTGARIVTLEGDEVVEDGTLLVTEAGSSVLVIAPQKGLTG